MDYLPLFVTCLGIPHTAIQARQHVPCSMSTDTSSRTADPVFVGASPTADTPTFMAALEREYPDIPSHTIYEAYESVIESDPALASDSEALKNRMRLILKKTGST